MKPLLASLTALTLATPLAAQQRQSDPRDMGGGRCEANVYNCADTPNPLAPNPSIWIEEMTWMDVRDALATGKTTVIIATGGVEPNGPWLVTGKHNYVLRANCEAIARDLGDALCAPIVKFVPEGNIDPPSGHMRSPGTISVREETFQALLTDIARSLHAHGFEHVVFIGDSGGNRRGMEAVAAALAEEWGDSASAFWVPEYYTVATEWDRNPLVLRGLMEPDRFGRDGLHDEPTIALNMMATDPESARWSARVEAGLATIDGFSIEDLDETLRLAREIVEARSGYTADLIRERRGGM